MKLNIKLPFFQFLLGLALMSAPLGCKTTTKAANQPNTVIENQSISSITYIADVRPIMLEKCTPCHFPDKGIKKRLDTYESTKDNIADILHRVQLSPNERKFMPYKSKNTPLTPEEISILKSWVEQGMGK